MYICERNWTGYFGFGIASNHTIWKMDEKKSSLKQILARIFFLLLVNRSDEIDGIVLLKISESKANTSNGLVYGEVKYISFAY